MQHDAACSSSNMWAECVLANACILQKSWRSREVPDLQTLQKRAGMLCNSCALSCLFKTTAAGGFLCFVHRSARDTRRQCSWEKVERTKNASELVQKIFAMRISKRHKPTTLTERLWLPNMWAMTSPAKWAMHCQYLPWWTNKVPNAYIADCTKPSERRHVRIRWYEFRGPGIDYPRQFGTRNWK